MNTKVPKINETALSADPCEKQLFVGIDVHKNSWTVTIHSDLFEHKTFNQPPDTKKLVKYIRDRFPDYSVQCAYEAGFSGYWLQRELQQAGMTCLVVNPSDIPTTDKENKYKEDRRDSSCLKGMLRQFEFFRKEKLGTELELRSYVRKQYSTDYYLLRSIPGIGPIVSIALLSELGDIRRFNTTDQLCNCIGLVPSFYSSGDRATQRGITPRSKLLLRSYLVESSWIAVRTDSALTDYYRKNAGKIAPNKNIVKVCSKLIARIYHVIKTGEKYQNNKTK